MKCWYSHTGLHAGTNRKTTSWIFTVRKPQTLLSFNIDIDDLGFTVKAFFPNALIISFYNLYFIDISYTQFLRDVFVAGGFKSPHEGARPIRRFLLNQALMKLGSKLTGT